MSAIVYTATALLVVALYCVGAWNVAEGLRLMGWRL